MTEISKKPVDERSKLVKKAAVASVATAVTLIIAKVVAFVLTGSMAILATMMDSFLDFLASLVNMVAVKKAAVPADKEHRFGHGKFEALSGLAQSAFVFGSGIMLLITAFDNYGRGYKPINVTSGVAVMVFSVIVTAVLLAFQTYVVRKTSSVAIEGDKAHYTGDLAINGSVIVSLLAEHFFELGFLDALFAALIALYLMFAAFLVFKKSFAMLTDMEISDDERKKILDILLSNKSVTGVYDLRTRSSGTKLFVQCILEMDGRLTLNESHLICDLVERDINMVFPNAEVFIHQCPADVEFINNRKIK